MNDFLFEFQTLKSEEAMPGEHFTQNKHRIEDRSISELVGIAKGMVTTSLDYLVVGLMGNEDWAHSTFGRKIQQAIDFNAKSNTIAILAEDAWANALCSL